jgi:hypothetical protein
VNGREGREGITRKKNNTAISKIGPRSEHKRQGGVITNVGLMKDVGSDEDKQKFEGVNSRGKLDPAWREKGVWRWCNKGETAT